MPELLARAPSEYKRYHEPFLGGGAMFFEMAPASAVLTDANAELIGCYEAIRSDVQSVTDVLRMHRELHSPEYFYKVRAHWNQKTRAPQEPERAAEFIYLNKTCYNGLWRVNRKGCFNVPIGRYANPRLFDPDRIRSAAEALKNAELCTGSFENVLDDAEAGDFVYFDPPYVPVSATANFASYTAASFGPSDQQRLAHVFRELVDRGCAVMLSNSDTPLSRRLFAGYKIDRVLCGRSINSKAKLRGAVAEVIVTNDY